MLVVCINPGKYNFTEGKEYEVRSEGRNKCLFKDNPYYSIRDNDGSIRFVSSKDFIKIEDIVKKDNDPNISIKKLRCLLPMDGFTVGNEYLIYDTIYDRVLVKDESRKWTHIPKCNIIPIDGFYKDTTTVTTFYFEEICVVQDKEQPNTYNVKCNIDTLDNFTKGKIYRVKEIININYELYFSVINDKGTGSIISAFCFDLMKKEEPVTEKPLSGDCKLNTL